MKNQLESLFVIQNLISIYAPTMAAVRLYSNHSNLYVKLVYSIYSLNIFVARQRFVDFLYIFHWKRKLPLQNCDKLVK